MTVPKRERIFTLRGSQLCVFCLRAVVIWKVTTLSKNALSQTTLQAKMQNNLQVAASKEAQICFDEVCKRHGWTLRELAKAAGYSYETLLKAQRPGSGVTFNAKMREAIERTSHLHAQKSNFAENLTRQKETDPAENVDIVIEELQELLRDFGRASIYGRRRLMERIEELIASLRVSMPLSKPKQSQIQNQ